jgi:RNase P/RNase MRP subunit p30
MNKWMMHSEEYVIKIIEECGYTTYEVMEYMGSQAISYLRQYKAKDIRKILGGVHEHKRNT